MCVCVFYSIDLVLFFNPMFSFLFYFFFLKKKKQGRKQHQTAFKTRLVVMLAPCHGFMVCLCVVMDL